MHTQHDRNQSFQRGQRWRRVAATFLAASAGTLAFASPPALAQVEDPTVVKHEAVAPLPDYRALGDDSNPAWQPNPLAGGISLSQTVSMDVSTNGSAALDYVAAILDRDPDDNLFIKVQNNGGTTEFTHIGFYHANNLGGWAGMTGGTAFLELDPADQFSSARMTVAHDGAGNVTVFLTDVVGGTNNQVYVRGGWVPRDGASTGYGAFAGTQRIDDWGTTSAGDVICDDFNRPGGELGTDWITTDGSSGIAANRAGGTSSSRSYYIGDCGALQRIEADVSVVGTSGGYCALVLNSDGADNLYIKVQQQEAGGQFDYVGFYSGLNSLGWAGQTGGANFFAIPVAWRFHTAHMAVTLDTAGTVRLILSNLDGVETSLLEFQRGGWAVLAGDGAGIGGWTGDNIIDDVAINSNLICDNFNRPNGPLGSEWIVEGDGGVVLNSARMGGLTLARAIFVGECGECPGDVNGDGVVNVVDLLTLLAAWGSCN